MCTSPHIYSSLDDTKIVVRQKHRRWQNLLISLHFDKFLLLYLSPLADMLLRLDFDLKKKNQRDGDRVLFRNEASEAYIIFVSFQK